MRGTLFRYQHPRSAIANKRHKIGDRGGQVSEPPRPDDGRPGPERMRQAVADYVRWVHEAYVTAARTFPPAVQGRMPLLAGGPFSVAAVGTRHLHLVATREILGNAAATGHGPVVAVEGEAPPLRWTVHFFDPVVLPALGLLDERSGPAFDEVRRLLGIRTHIYHLTLQAASLAAHHAGHTGAGLAGAHAAAARDFEAIRAALDEARIGLANELEGALLAGLPRAAGLLARSLAPDDPEVTRLAAQAVPDPAALRRAVLHAVRAAAAGGASGGGPAR
jgi:hypothetical protein